MKCGWMDWADIVPYREQLIEMEMDLMITYHYPDWNIPRSYVEKHVDALEQYIDSGNTFFWGVRDDKILYGYMWGYVSNFINIKRWNRRSTYFQNALRGKGFAMLGMEASLEKAKELGCNQMSTHYAVFNDRMKAFLEKSGFVETRVEMVKNI
jgi:GNAT superfamily N-acetyltransferase